MSEQTQKPPESKEKPLTEPEPWMQGCGFFVGLVIAVFFLCVMFGKCSCSHSDDTWDILEHKVNTDPYFRQWD